MKIALPLLFVPDGSSIIATTTVLSFALMRSWKLVTVDLRSSEVPRHMSSLDIGIQDFHFTILDQVLKRTL
jgi:hypothetical protein